MDPAHYYLDGAVAGRGHRLGRALHGARRQTRHHYDEHLSRLGLHDLRVYRTQKLFNCVGNRRTPRHLVHQHVHGLHDLADLQVFVGHLSLAVRAHTHQLPVQALQLLLEPQHRRPRQEHFVRGQRHGAQRARPGDEPVVEKRRGDVRADSARRYQPPVGPHHVRAYRRRLRHYFLFREAQTFGLRRGEGQGQPRALSQRFRGFGRRQRSQAARQRADFHPALFETVA